jgi:hypothetical protein
LEKNISTEKHEASIHTQVLPQKHIQKGTRTSLQEKEFTEGVRDIERKGRGEGASRPRSHHKARRICQIREGERLREEIQKYELTKRTG